MDKLRSIISEYTGIPEEKIDPNMSLTSDMGIDSFALISMICEIENEFGVDIPDSEMKNFSTLNDVYAFVSRT